VRVDASVLGCAEELVEFLEPTTAALLKGSLVAQSVGAGACSYGGGLLVIQRAESLRVGWLIVAGMPAMWLAKGGGVSANIAMMIIVA